MAVCRTPSRATIPPSQPFCFVSPLRNGWLTDMSVACFASWQTTRRHANRPVLLP